MHCFPSTIWYEYYSAVIVVILLISFHFIILFSIPCRLGKRNSMQRNPMRVETKKVLHQRSWLTSWIPTTGSSSGRASLYFRAAMLQWVNSVPWLPHAYSSGSDWITPGLCGLWKLNFHVFNPCMNLIEKNNQKPDLEPWWKIMGHLPSSFLVDCINSLPLPSWLLVSRQFRATACSFEDFRRFIR